MGDLGPNCSRGQKSRLARRVNSLSCLYFQSEGGSGGGGSDKEQSESSTSQNLDLGFPDDDDEPNNPEGNEIQVSSTLKQL